MSEEIVTLRVLQRIPSACNAFGSERANALQSQAVGQVQCNAQHHGGDKNCYHGYPAEDFNRARL